MSVTSAVWKLRVHVCINASSRRLRKLLKSLILVAPEKQAPEVEAFLIARENSG